MYGTSPIFTADCTETICVACRNTTAASKNDLRNTTEDDLCCQCYDHWRQFLEFGKDKSVDCTADCTNNQVL